MSEGTDRALADDRVRELATRWLRVQGQPIRSVNKLDSYGTDWAGSTEEGFYSQFCVNLNWTDTAGQTHYDAIQGEAMESLWRFVLSEATRS